MNVETKSTIADIFPLSPLQHGVLFHTLYEGTSVYVTAIAARLTGALDIKAFGDAWQSVVDRHDSLRAGFFSHEVEVPVQVIMANAMMPIEVQDWCGQSSAAQDRALEVFIKSDRERGFDLTKPPLMRLSIIRLSEETYHIIWTSHHILIDGWSVPILLREVFEAYDAFARGSGPDWPPAPSYRDYVQWLQSQDMEKAERYWRKRLSGFAGAPPLLLPTPSVPTVDERQFDRHAEYNHIFGIELSALESFARRQKVTINTLVQATWAIILSRLTNVDDVVFGVALSGRPTDLHQAATRVGLYINTLPLRVVVPRALSINPLLKELQSLQAELLEFQYSPLSDVKRWSGLEGNKSLFESIFTFENYPSNLADKMQLGEDVTIADMCSIERPHYALNLQFAAKHNLSFKIIYATDLFDAATIERLSGCFETLLEAILADPDQPVGSLPLLNPAQRHQLLVEWNETETVYPSEKCIHELFEAQVARHSEAPAVIHKDESLSYRELNERSNQLAYYLRALGVGPDVLVAICMERSLEMIIGLLAILKAGGAYVPLDPNYPSERLSFMLNDCGASIILSLTKQGKNLPLPRGRLLLLDDDWPIIARSPYRMLKGSSGPNNLAYVIYTSGSTGLPKGVMVEHRSAVNLALAQGIAFGVSPGSRVLQFAPLSFDASFSEVSTALLRGATLCLPDAEAVLLGKELAQTLMHHRITHVTLPPNVLTSLLEIDCLLEAETIVVAGSAFPARLVKRCGTNRNLFNAYGPTEATVCASLYQCASEGSTKTVPIGRPIANTRIYILDDRLSPVPIGVRGEIYIGGVGVARGYLNCPDLTMERFITSPFVTGDRLYKSGDLGRYLPDANIEFLGRNDFQVKIRGFRVELGEIESRLCSHPLIRDGLVLAIGGADNEPRLVAYYVTYEGAQEELGAKTLRAYLASGLPEHMVPAAYVRLKAIPLTINGKVNREALPVPDDDAYQHRSYEPPRSPIEEILVKVWADALRLERVGVYDNFFELGGDSLLAMRVVVKLREACGAEISIHSIFDSPTISGLAARLDSARSNGLESQNATTCLL